ncbi:hypothetical protein LB505_010168 [Fusarium chuoi]|nr:hypothetical protein LB505_010168 [Fusarium chuoi]
MPTNQPMSARERAIKHFQSLAPGPDQPGEGTETYRNVDELAYALSRVPTFTPRPVRIVAIGAGFAVLRSPGHQTRSGNRITLSKRISYRIFDQLPNSMTYGIT